MSSFSLWTEDHGKNILKIHPLVHILPLSSNHREREIERERETLTEKQKILER